MPSVIFVIYSGHKGKEREKLAKLEAKDNANEMKKMMAQLNKESGGRGSMNNKALQSMMKKSQKINRKNSLAPSAMDQTGSSEQNQNPPPGYQTMTPNKTGLLPDGSKNVTGTGAGTDETQTQSPKDAANNAKLLEKESLKQQRQQFISTGSKMLDAHFGLYVVSVGIRLFLEISFFVLQFRLFGTKVPGMIKCSLFPCPNLVDCFISRPMEKTIFLRFMYVLSFICCIFNIIEFHYMIIKIIQISFKQSKFRRQAIAQLDKMRADKFDCLDACVPFKKRKFNNNNTHGNSPSELSIGGKGPFGKHHQNKNNSGSSAQLLLKTDVVSILHIS